MSSSTSVEESASGQRSEIPRKIVVSLKEDEYSPYCSNRVVTSAYTMQNFLVKNLFKQFSKLANIYFLGITALQIIPWVTLTNGIPTTVAPLFFVLLVNGIKDALEDYKRHQADTIENNRSTQILRTNELGNSKFRNCTWKDIKVGNIIKVAADETVPADMIIICTYNESGNCYVMTSNLDGETNLKMRETHSFFRNKLNYMPTEDNNALVRDLQSIEIRSENPNRYLDIYHGIVAANNKKNPIVRANTILRGVQLRNTKWALGIVTCTGHDTKIQQNTSETTLKSSWLLKFTNQVTLSVLCMQIILCISAVLVSPSFNSLKQAWYISPAYDENGALDRFWLFWTYVLLFANFLPISYLVTLDLTRFLQSISIASDSKMVFNNLPAKVHTSDLVEEIGTISHIFSDKTGTLTKNRMCFRKCSIAGVCYGNVEENTDLALNCSFAEKNRYVNFLDPKFDVNFKKGHVQFNNIKNFFLNLAINNGSIPEGESDSANLRYSGASPDECTLVYAASQVDIKLLERCPQYVSLNVLGKKVQVEILHNFEFTSARKKSSSIVRMEDGRIMVFSKGADNVIFNALKNGHRSTQSLEKSNVSNSGDLNLNDIDSYSTSRQIYLHSKEHMMAFSEEGLRVLCIAQKEISEDEYTIWHEKYTNLTANGNQNDEEVAALIYIMESDLQLIGITGIEDELQNGVPSAIQNLRHAGIRIWMLTGDRVNTAEHIGLSTKLTYPSMKFLRLVLSDFEDLDCTKELLNSLLNGFNRESLANTDQERALIVDDKAIEYISLHDAEELFLSIAFKCRSVICARVSPKQKEFIVDIVRKLGAVNTLAIGDGANDVPMIQRAHVGVGINGSEGSQAANSSDFVISQFKFLERLLLIHGRQATRRSSIMTLYMFYKNIFLVLPQIYYGQSSLFSGQNIYFDGLYQLYNVAYTALPILVFTIFDKDVSEELCIKIPILYQDGVNQVFLNRNKFWLWILEAVITSFITLLIPLFSLRFGSISESGHDAGFWVLGLIVNFVVVVVVNFRLGLEIKYWFWFTFVSIIFSIMVWLWSVFVFSNNIFFGATFYGVLYYSLSLKSILFILILTITSCLLGSYSIYSASTIFYPSCRDICREIDVKHKRATGGIHSKSAGKSINFNKIFNESISTNKILVTPSAK